MLHVAALIIRDTTVLPILSTCPLHINSGCGKREAHNNNWPMVGPAKAAPVTGTTLRTTDLVPADSRQ